MTTSSLLVTKIFIIIYNFFDILVDDFGKTIQPIADRCFRSIFEKPILSDDITSRGSTIVPGKGFEKSSWQFQVRTFLNKNLWQPHHPRFFEREGSFGKLLSCKSAWSSQDWNLSFFFWRTRQINSSSPTSPLTSFFFIGSTNNFFESFWALWAGVEGFETKAFILFLNFVLQLKSFLMNLKILKVLCKYWNPIHHAKEVFSLSLGSLGYLKKLFMRKIFCSNFFVVNGKEQRKGKNCKILKIFTP